MMQNKTSKCWRGIHPSIAEYWEQTCGSYYVCSYVSGDWIIYVENATIDTFHPSGAKLARHNISTGQTTYIWNNNVKELLTESQFLLKMAQEAWRKD
jgi:hypothetical protein